MSRKTDQHCVEFGDQQHLVWMGGTSSLGGLEAEDTWEDDLRSELEGPLERQRRIAELLNRFDGDGPGSEEVLEVLGLDRGLDVGQQTFILTSELQPATQRLIDRLGCRHPATLQRVSQVYASVARREGLSLTELKGYVACVLTQILRELDPATPTPDPPTSPRIPKPPTGPGWPPGAESPGGPGCSSDGQPEPSDLQRLMQELSSLNRSLDRRGVGCSNLDLEAEPASETPGEESEVRKSVEVSEADGAEQMRLLRKELEALSLSLQHGTNQNQKEEGGESRTSTEPARPASPVFEAPRRSEAVFREPGTSGLAPGPRTGPAVAMLAATLAQRDMGSLGSYPAGSVIDPGNTYARALRHAQRPLQSGAEPSSVEGCAAVLRMWPPRGPASTGEPDHAVLRPMADGWQSRLKGASKGIAHGWQAFAETMDGIFVPEAGVDTVVESAEDVEDPKEGSEGPEGFPPSRDVPSIFRQPSVEEVRELLEQEGLPAHVAIASAGCFCLKKLCLDRSSHPSLYVLDCESSVPALFLGMQGFCLHELRRVVLGTAPSAKPLLSLEFDEGFLPVRLGSATVLYGVLGVLCEGRQVQIVQQPDWS
ncbi:unnamed protein product [Symbiodinium sp. CCMP2592]|nr:unnamed protein product [Symbiodinium sp. CCMP2592]